MRFGHKLPTPHFWAAPSFFQINPSDVASKKLSFKPWQQLTEMIRNGWDMLERKIEGYPGIVRRVS